MNSNQSSGPRITTNYFVNLLKITKFAIVEHNSLTGLRHINSDLVSKFKKSGLYNLIKEYDLLACIRNNAIGIYYNSDRVAKVSLSNNELMCEVSSYYLSDFYLTGIRKKSETVYVSDNEIIDKIESIIQNSRKRETPEKKAQQHMVYLNNTNKDSNWFCFDIEYRQSTATQTDIPKFIGRFDILAISKDAPHRIAIIELKYGKDALGGKCGIVKHLKDFRDFNGSKSCHCNLSNEIPSILKNLKEIGYDVPPQLTSDSIEISEHIEYYVICLYEGESTRGTVGGYLFDKKRPNWQTSRISEFHNAVTELGIDVESPTCPIDVTFLFKRASSPTDFNIPDILNKAYYD